MTAVDVSQEQPETEESALEQVNILPLLMKLKPDWVSKRAKKVVSDAKDDNDSREDYMKNYANQLKLFAGVIPNFGYPAQGAKAPHIMLMTKSILHSWARITDQVVPAKGDVVKVNAIGPEQEDQARSIRVERHMNWQLRHRMPDWASSIQVSILSWLMAGSTFRHYRWDPIENTHAIDHVPVDDIIVSYTAQDDHPQMKKVERVTRVLRLARWELELYEDRGHYSNLESLFPEEGEGEENGSTADGDILATSSETDDSVVREAADKIQGVEAPPNKSKDKKREIYEQHMMLTFPKDLGYEDLDGKTLPVAFVVDREKRIPLAVTILEEPDPIDLARFQEQSQAYEMAAQNTPPGMPPAGKEPKPVRMQRVSTIIHYKLFPNPSGFYGMGLGSLLQHSNELANALAGEYVLSAKFYNMFCGWLARGTKEKRGDVQMSHGKFVETELEPEVLDKAIKVMEGRPPSEALMKVVEKLEENAEIGASVDILSGEKGASNETARGMMIRNSQAMALISVMTRLWLEPLKYELKLIAHGNSIYLDEYEYFPFAKDIPGKPGEQEISREKIFRNDYLEDVHIEFTADARMISKPERIGTAKDVIDMAMQLPMLAQNPGFMHFAISQYFVVAEMPQYIAAMGPPPQPPPPPSPESQDVENAGFFNEKDHPALPDDNHVEHLHKIEELQKSPLYENMSSTGKQMLDRHKRAHVGAFYLQLQALQKETGVNVHALASASTSRGMAPGGTGAEAPPEMGGEAGGGPEAPPDGGPPGGIG